ncbi:serine/threonine-protein kinase [Ensifer adhaerens]|uniref:serine/threonine-protein kinase n=1 Tax=Ensifer adhaerens TaxID=106592 RepID=UPI00384D5CEB
MMEKTPAKIGRYKVAGKIGAGAMGAIYQAEDPAIARNVAIKVIRSDLPQGGEREQLLTRFRNEARAAGQCAHAGIVTIFDYGQWRGNPYIVMERVLGSDLQVLIDEGQLSLSESTKIVVQVLDALAHIHKQGIIHGDIKSRNIVLTEAGSPKIMDFGLATNGGEASVGSTHILGTPNYMAPEQLMGLPIDHRADLYSVGVLLHRMVVGRSPYGTENLAEVLHKISDPFSIEVLETANLPTSIAEVISKALQKDVAQRFQSATEFSRALRHALSEGESRRSGYVGHGAQAAPDVHEPLMIEDSLIREITRQLAQILGPITSLLIQESLLVSRSISELLEKLSSYVEDPLERAGFVTKFQESLDKLKVRSTA